MAIELATSTDVARPLRILVPLIKADLKQASEAAKNAALPYFAAAGEKMIEARVQMKATEFDGWTKRNFNVGIRQANEYMNYARHNSDSSIVANVTTLRQVIHATRNNPNYGKPAPWREAIGKVDVSALRQAALDREAERALQRKLALSLVDIGYKALASKLHPDRGGSSEAMTRLNRVRELLRGAVT